MSKFYLFLILFIYLSLVGGCTASENGTVDLQRETLFTAYANNSIESQTTFAIINSNHYSLYNQSLFFTKDFLYINHTRSLLSVWDSKNGILLCGYVNCSSAEEARKIIEEQKPVPFAPVYNTVVLGKDIQRETVATLVDNIDLNPNDIVFIKMNMKSENYVKDLNSGLPLFQGEPHPEFENYSVLYIFEPSTGEYDRFDIKKDELYVSLPNDAYNYTDSVFTVPPYNEISYSGDRVVLKWDLTKMDYSSIRGIFTIIYQVHENKVKRNVDSATIDSFELAKKADTISKISLVISLISLFITWKTIDWKAKYFQIRKWIVNKINRIIYGDYDSK